MVGIIQANVKALRGFEPQPTVSLGGTDARLWRYIDVPAHVSDHPRRRAPSAVRPCGQPCLRP